MAESKTAKGLQDVAKAARRAAREVRKIPQAPAGAGAGSSDDFARKLGRDLGRAGRLD